MEHTIKVTREKMSRVYSAKVYRLTNWTMTALDRLKDKHPDNCECDLDYQCSQCKQFSSIAIRYAQWREKNLLTLPASCAIL